jgi:hypothetical protein
VREKAMKEHGTEIDGHFVGWLNGNYTNDGELITDNID